MDVVLAADTNVLVYIPLFTFELIVRYDERVSLPEEKFRSLIYVRDFLRRLLDPKVTPRVPRAVRKEAYCKLKHFPSDRDLDKIRDRCPDILGKQGED